MRKLIEIADEYVRTSDWKTIAVLKFCLMAIGMLFGLMTPQRHRKSVRDAALCVFVITYIPLMLKLYRTASSMRQ